MMIDLLSILKTKNLVTALLLLAYVTTSLIPFMDFNKKHVFGLSGGYAMVKTSEILDLPVSDPIPAEPKSSDTEDKFSLDDESFIEFSSTSISTTLDYRRFYHVNGPPLPGAINTPFSPPEIRIA